MVKTHYRWNPITDNVLCEQDEDGNVLATYAHESALHGDLISQNRGGQKSYYQYDGQGSTRALTDENGDVTDTYTYDAFGETVARTGTTVNPYRYIGAKGYQYDEETDDYYIRRRTYEPTNARWLSADPLGLVDGETLYIYVHNRPLMLQDPTGQLGIAIGHGNGTFLHSGVDLLCKVRECKDFEWDPTLCNQGFPEDNCACSETKTNEPPDRSRCNAMIEKLKQQLLPLPCDDVVLDRFFCGSDCVSGSAGFSVTCCRVRSDGKRQISVCINRSNRTGCDMQAFMEHEIVHVRQYIQAACDPSTIPPPGGDCARPDSLAQSEREAYTHQCTLQADHGCLKGQSRIDKINKCVADGTTGSTNEGTIGNIKAACNKIN